MQDSGTQRKYEHHLDLGHLTKTTNGGLRSNSSSGAWLPGTASNNLGAALALPDAHICALHRVLAAERAVVLRVLRDLVLLHNLTERRTIASSVLSTNPRLLSALAHLFALRPPC